MRLIALSMINSANLTAALKRAIEFNAVCRVCLLYTSDAADERSSVDLGGRRIIKKKNCECKQAMPRQRRTDKNYDHTAE